MVERLSAEAMKAALWVLAGWSDLAGREAIAKTFVFKDFLGQRADDRLF